MDKAKVFDYIVVGGGAAGCVVASRLSEDTNMNVLLIEAGPHADHPFINMTGGYFKIHGTNRTFLFQTEPEPAANNRKLPLLQGRTLGGGSSINAMCYSRGQKEDYDDWAKDGCTGWSYQDVLPYFKKAEKNSRLAGHYHGAEGPMNVSDGVYKHELSNAFVVAAQQAEGLQGLPAIYNHDFNAEDQKGVGFYQTMSSRGERSSSYSAYIKPFKDRANLEVWTDSTALKILFDGEKAKGIHLRKSNQIIDVYSSREIVLCLGTFMTPKLLMLSGVGAKEHLMEHGIQVVLDSPNVGENYQDHVLVPVDADLNEPISLMGQDRGFKAVFNGLQWYGSACFKYR